MPTKLEVYQAGELIKLSYNYKKKRKAQLKNVTTTLDLDGVQAFLLKDKTLVIPGSNELSDYTDFNILNSKKKGIRGRYFHRGFLKHAQVIMTHFSGKRPKRIIGHSLGAASAQIVGLHFNVPTIAFASPKVLSGSNSAWGESKIANFQRVDDPVCNYPTGEQRFRHVGNCYWMAPGKFDLGMNHKVQNYMKLLKQTKRHVGVPRYWPK